MRPGTRSTLLVASLALLSSARTPAQQGWTFVPSPAPGTSTNILYDVEGEAWDDAWAVGFYSDQGTPSKIYTLTLHQDGSGWRVVPSPNPDPDTRQPYNHLLGVVPLGRDQALAVGMYNSASGESQTLAMEWDGQAWSVIPSPSQKGGSSFLCADRSPSGVAWAGGGQVSPGVAFQEALIAGWDGSSWQEEPAPYVGLFRNQFWGVSALSDQEVYCVGTQGDSYGDFQILVQRYDGGSSWTTFNVPTPGWMDSLYGVAAVDSDDVWAVGGYYDTNLFLIQPLILHFDGSAWSQVSLPPYPQGSCELRAITAVDEDRVFAGGTYTDNGVPRPFLLQYDGGAWNEVTLPPSGGGYEWFRGLGTVPGGEVWLVGQYFDGSVTAPITYRGEALDLDATPTPAVAGDTLTFESGPARTGDPTMLFSTQVDGAPFVQFLAVGKAGADGWWRRSVTVPPGLAGHSVQFQSYVLDARKVFQSSFATVQFQ